MQWQWRWKAAMTPGTYCPMISTPLPGFPWGALLPGLDPTVMGWQARSWYLGPHAGQLFDRSGNAGPTIWWDGRLVGAWGQDADGRVRLEYVEDVGASARKVLQRKASELTDWLDGVRIKPRFPSPLAQFLSGKARTP